jgi:biopolymer transport protein ExbD
MGMTVGGNKGEVVADPNIVPLIDVLLVPIIIFTVMPSRSTGLPTLVPRPAPPQARTEPERSIVVQAMQDGKVMANDAEVPSEEVARAIDIMRGARIEDVGLIPGDASVRRKTL